MTPQQHAPMLESSLIWVARKLGRGFRFMLAVPDDPNLKTYASRHPPPLENVTYTSRVCVMGPNIPSRPQAASLVEASEPVSASPRQNLAPARRPSRPGTQISRPPKTSNETTRINNNTTIIGTTLASPLNGRHTRAPHTRGYDQDAFVTVLNPSVASLKSEKTMAGYGAGGMWKKDKVGDEDSEVTAWPEADC